MVKKRSLQDKLQNHKEYGPFEEPVTFVEHSSSYDKKTYRLRKIAGNYFANRGRFYDFKKKHNTPDACCFFVLGKKVLGYGRDMMEAIHMAENKHANSRDGIIMFYHDPPIMHSDAGCE